MMNRFLRYLLIIYTFFLPLQTRLFLVDSGVEYQRISLYGTQILFFIILIAYFFCHSRPDAQVGINSDGNPKNKQKQTVIASEVATSVAISSEAQNEIASSQAPRNDKSFSFCFLDSKRNFGMTIFLLLFLFVGMQVIVTKRIDLTFQTLLWITQAFLFIWIVRREELVRILLWVFIVSMCFQSVFIWVQVFTQFIPAFKWLGLAEQVSSVGGVSVVETTFGRFLRGYGSFSHPNIAGGWLLVAIIVTSKFKVQSSKFKALFFTALGLLVSGLVLTFSRSAILGLIVFIISQCIYALSSRSFSLLRRSGYEGWIRDPDTNNKQKQTVVSTDPNAVTGERRNPFPMKYASRKRSLDNARDDRRGFLSTIHYSLITLLVLLAIIIPFRDLIFSRADIGNRLESKSIIERNIYSDQAKMVIKDNLWFGTGLGNYTVELQKQYPNRPTYEYQPPHNVILLALSELGVFGLVLVVFAFWTWFRIKYQESSVKKTPTRSPPYQGGDERGGESSFFHFPSSMVFGLLPILFFDHYLWSLYAGLMLVAMVLLISRIGESSDSVGIL